MNGSATGATLRNVQALRAVAALLVVLDHMNGELSYDAGSSTLFRTFGYVGNFGVDAFFAISGFIMLVTTWSKFGTPDAGRTFLVRRLVRIYPPYWIVLAPIVVTYLVASHELMRAHAGHADILASLLLLPQANTPLLVVSWTLVFEMYFYLVFAAVVAGPTRRFLPALGIWFVLQTIAATAFGGNGNPYLGFLGSPMAIEFMLGTLVGYAYVSGAMPGAVPVGVAGALAVVAVWFANAHGIATADLGVNGVSRVVQFGIPAAALVYGLVGLERRTGRGAGRGLVRLGDASYALYLLHVPATIAIGAVALRLHVRGPLADGAVQLATLAVIVAAALAFHLRIEAPLTRRLNARIAAGARPAAVRKALA